MSEVIIDVTAVTPNQVAVVSGTFQPDLHPRGVELAADYEIDVKWSHTDLERRPAQFPIAVAPPRWSRCTRRFRAC